MHLTARILLTTLILGVVAQARAGEAATTIEALLATVPPGGMAGVAMAQLDQRQWVVRRNADQPLSLASTTKLVTTAATLIGLGADYQFRTRLVGLGPLSSDGTLPGLGVIGGGSPCFDEHFAQGRDPDNVLRGFAAELKRQGVQRIGGDLVIDARLFSGPIRPATWPDDQANLQRWFSAPSSAFAWNDNCIEVRIIPGAVDKPCTIETRPRSPRIKVINQTRSLASGAGKNAISRSLNSNTVVVSGTCGRTTAWFPLAIESDPDLMIGDHFKALLTDAGIPVSGNVRLGAVDPAVGPLLVDVRQPLMPAINICNQRSQNFYAEQFLRLLGAAKAGEGSLVAGRIAAVQVLEGHFGAGMGPLTLVDGCGLSYGNEASATYLVNLLDAMHRSEFGPSYRASLKDKDLQGIRGLVKTGTHNESRALAGYLMAGDQRLYAFAILLNRGTAPGITWANALREKLYEALAGLAR
ncbi:MAG: D-alanyl-D-alanine carboxypeptidase/D-alanyl-D-alanine-endopeptidase [Planctomycetes bacterium]|nr:D-alanyl-D-alanine carboxypeptidase/D-alanyl-D-alanine-endopeptidase [Planctomycetota bacterium]